MQFPAVRSENKEDLINNGKLKKGNMYCNGRLSVCLGKEPKCRAIFTHVIPRCQLCFFVKFLIFLFKIVFPIGTSAATVKAVISYIIRKIRFPLLTATGTCIPLRRWFFNQKLQDVGSETRSVI